MSKNNKEPDMKRHRLPTALLLITGVTLVLASLLLQQLKQGISLDSLHLGNLHFEHISLTLDGKLTLFVDRLRVSVVNQREQRPQQSEGPLVEPQKLKRLLSAIRHGTRLFRHIDIRTIEGRRLNGAFLYRENEPGYLKLHSARSSIELAISGNEQQLQFDLLSLDLLQRGIQAKGSATIDVAQRRLRGDFRGLLAETLPIALSVDADRQQLSFDGRGLHAIDNIEPIVALFPLPESVKPWITDYLVARAFHLDSISGTLPFSDPAALLQTLRVTARAIEGAYTFAQGLEPILATEATVILDSGVLKIIPRDGTFYGLDGGDSFLDIDFNDRPFLLTANIRALAPASGGVLALLQHYGIPFPFEQVQGLTDVDLTLGIGLRSQPTIAAVASLSTEDAAFMYRAKRYPIPKLDMDLKDTLLTFNRLELALTKGVTLALSGRVDAHRKSGELAIAVESLQVPPGRSGLSLETSAEAPTTALLQLNPSGHELTIPATSWRYGGRRIEIAPFSTPLEIDSVTGQIPPTLVSMDTGLRARVQGTFNATRRTADARVDLLHLPGKNLRLAQQQATLALQLGSGITLTTARPVKLTSKGVALQLAPSRVHYADRRLRIEHSGFEIDGSLSTELSGELDNRSRSGALALRDLILRNAMGKATFAADEATLKLARDDHGLDLNSPELGLSVTLKSDGGWTLDCPDLAPLQRYSSLLQSQHIDRGAFHIEAPAKAQRFEFSGWLDFPYALLIQDDKPTGRFRFSGWRQGSRTHIDINQAIALDLGRHLRASSIGVGYNLPELLRLARTSPAEGPQPKQPKQEQEQDKTGRHILLRARDTKLRLSDDRHILADNLLIQSKRGIIKFQLRHGIGQAVMTLEDGQLQLAGNHFNHHFINGLMAGLGDFDQGVLEVRANGSLQQLEGALAIRDFVVKDFKALTNTLAFINRLPAAMNFNPPPKKGEGLHVREAAVAFVLADGVMELKSLLIDSDEMTVAGKGILDFGQGTTDMIFLLESAARKSRSKIPVLGFILEGKDDNTTVAVKLQGDMNNPEVSSTFVKELVTYPFKILARTVLLPVHLVQSVQSPKEPDGAHTEPP